MQIIDFMLKTIEEKLAAIKVINQQKEMVDTIIELIIKVPEQAVRIDISHHLNILPKEKMDLVQKRIDDTLTDIGQIVVDALYTQRDELITKAKELMK